MRSAGPFATAIFAGRRPRRLLGGDDAASSGVAAVHGRQPGLGGPVIAKADLAVRMPKKISLGIATGLTSEDVGHFAGRSLDDRRAAQIPPTRLRPAEDRSDAAQNTPGALEAPFVPSDQDADRRGAAGEPAGWGCCRVALSADACPTARRRWRRPAKAARSGEPARCSRTDWYRAAAGRIAGG